MEKKERIVFKKNEVDIQVCLVQFKEDGNFIVYCPSLEMTGYGCSEEEALDSFKIVLEEQMQYMLEHDTLRRELKRMGWSAYQSKPLDLKAKPLSQIANTNKGFRRIINNFDFNKQALNVRIPACV